MNPASFIIGGSLVAAVLLTPEQPKPMLRLPAHVNEVVAKDVVRVSVEFSVLIEVIDPPETHGEMIRTVAGKDVLLEIPLYDRVDRSLGTKGVRARVVSQ